MSLSTRKKNTLFVVLGFALAASVATYGFIVRQSALQIFDLPEKPDTLAPEWTDNQHIALLSSEWRNKPSFPMGWQTTGHFAVTVTVQTVRGGETGLKVNCCSDAGCSGRWAAAIEALTPYAAWAKQEHRWLPCHFGTGFEPAITAQTGQGSRSELMLPGTPLGSLPDGRFVYTPSPFWTSNSASVDAWNAQTKQTQHVGVATFTTGIQLFTACLSPDGTQICWLGFDLNSSASVLPPSNTILRWLHRYLGKTYPSQCVVAWMTNLDGSAPREVVRIHQPMFMSNRMYVQDYDEVIGPSGDEISWSCDSKFFAFVLGNGRPKKQLYVCRAD